MLRTFLLLLVFLPFFLPGQTIPAEDDIFSSDSLLELTLLVDMDSLISDRSADASYLPATLLHAEGNTIHQIHGEVKVRGNFRRRSENCEFPPLKLKLQTRRETGIFAGHRKFKIVTHCQEDEATVREFLVYRTLNHLTDYSFRTRLLRITYEDIHQRQEPFQRYAFLIEDEDQLAGRIQAKQIEDEHLHPDKTLYDHTTLVFLFHYMIGNTDFDVMMEKNIKLYQLENESAPIIIPYDFDWSEMVSASYANKILGDFDRRQFGPLCREREDLERIFEVFTNARDQIINTISSCVYLSEQSRQQQLALIREFYRDIRKEKVIRQVFLEGCE